MTSALLKTLLLLALSTLNYQVIIQISKGSDITVDYIIIACSWVITAVVAVFFSHLERMEVLPEILKLKMGRSEDAVTLRDLRRELVESYTANSRLNNALIDIEHKHRNQEIKIETHPVEKAPSKRVIWVKGVPQSPEVIAKAKATRERNAAAKKAEMERRPMIDHAKR